MRQGVGAHQHREFGEVFLRDAIFVHVARRDEAVIGGDRRPQSHLVVGVTDLRQRLDRGIAALPGQTIFAADHQHMLCDAGVDQVMRQHGHGETCGPADLHRMSIGWLDTKMLGENGRQHDVRRNRRIAAENAVDLGSLQPGIGNRKLGRLAHEIERGRSFVLAVGRQPDAGDEAHDRLSSSFRGARSANPESISPPLHAARWIPGSPLRGAPE